MKRIKLLGIVVALSLGACEQATGNSAAAPDASGQDTSLSDAATDATSKDAGQDTAASDAVQDTGKDSATDVAGPDTADVAVDTADAADTDTADTADTSVDAADTADAVLPEGACTDEVACTKPSWASCAPAGSFMGCGMCQKEVPGCSSDAECAGIANGICITSPNDCLCEPHPVCHTGCAGNADCGEGQICASDHHCMAQTCKTKEDCPAMFACGSDAKCTRQACKGSADCGGGWCVTGWCWVKPGECQLPVP
ncbi:MAG: hypothetical protein HY902_14970 [Deltaproteobacteria bacterium]|nr:hypothetical protein [Deltaproteobacteria bacterium]